MAFSISAAQLLVNDSDVDEDRSLLRVTAVADASHGTASIDANGNVSFMPAADYFGPASFRYRVTDTEGASTWATAHLTVQGVNDAPVIEDIWYGRPVYGYQFVGGEYPYMPVVSESQARAMMSAGTLLTLTGQQIALSSVTYYRNGQMRPIAIDTQDALGEYADDYDILFPYEAHDDPLRMNGGIVAFDPDGDSTLINFSVASGPTHGHAWTNVYVPWTAEAGGGNPNWNQSGGTPERGAWQYFAHLGDSFTGADPFVISVTDAQGASTMVSINTSHVGTSPGSGGGGGCPIVIDLSNDGIDLIRPEDSNVFMDINGDGWRDRIGWAAPSDAVLVFDANQDGRVDIDREVSFVDHLPGARTDLEGLAAHDTNGDGLLNAADARWKEFGMFQDRNGNGIQDEGEFISLDAAGLRSISLTREGVPELNQGNVVFGTSAVEWSDGRTTRAGDVMFAGDGIPFPEAAQMALLFSQLAALPALPDAEAATVFLPPQVDELTDAWAAAAAAAAAPTAVAVAA